MTMAITALGGLLGLLLGSFGNVVIARVPQGKSVVHPPSACPKCNYQITWRDNIPILSYLLLGGHCRQCAQPISSRYPLIEAVMAVVFAVYGYWVATMGDLYVLPGVWTFAFASVCLFVIDIDTFRLPNAITLPLTAAMVVMMGGAAVLNGQVDRLGPMAFGSMFIAGIFYLIHWIYPKGMGLGDVKYAVPMGIVLGYFGYGAVIVGYFIALIVGCVWGIWLWAKNGFKKRAPMPFGPSLVIGAMTGMVYGDQIAQLYLQVTGL